MTARRRLLIALGTGLVWRPLRVLAQQASSIPVVGVLVLSEGPVARLRQGLQKLGYVEGRNIRLEVRGVGEHYEHLAEVADELVRLKVDVIVAMGNTSTVGASKATATIPIVMVTSVDPVKEKLAVSLARPGRNVTGVTTIGQETVPKRLELARETMPGLTRIGVLWDPDSKASTNSIAQAREAAKTLKLQLHVVEARSPDDFDKSFEALVKVRVRVFVLMSASMFGANRKQLLDSAARHRLIGVLPTGDWADDGAPFAYGPDFFEAQRHGAVYVDKILKGAKPAELPIEQPTKFELTINLKTAKALGIKVPRSLLVRASRVIE